MIDVFTSLGYPVYFTISNGPTETWSLNLTVANYSYEQDAGGTLTPPIDLSTAVRKHCCLTCLNEKMHFQSFNDAINIMAWVGSMNASGSTSVGYLWLANTSATLNASATRVTNNTNITIELIIPTNPWQGDDAWFTNNCMPIS